MIILRLRLKATYPSAGKSMDKSESTYNVDNSGVLTKEALTYSLIIYDNTENIFVKQKKYITILKKC
jgi:hypothetical protein